MLEKKYRRAVRENQPQREGFSLKAKRIKSERPLWDANFLRAIRTISVNLIKGKPIIIPPMRSEGEGQIIRIGEGAFPLSGPANSIAPYLRHSIGLFWREITLPVSIVLSGEEGLRFIILSPMALILRCAMNHLTELPFVSNAIIKLRSYPRLP